MEFYDIKSDEFGRNRAKRVFNSRNHIKHKYLEPDKFLDMVLGFCYNGGIGSLENQRGRDGQFRRTDSKIIFYVINAQFERLCYRCDAILAAAWVHNKRKV